jgi:hypothetical protein
MTNTRSRSHLNYNEQSDDDENNDDEKKKNKKNKKKPTAEENKRLFMIGKHKPLIRKKLIKRFIGRYHKDRVKNCLNKNLKLYYTFRDKEQNEYLSKKWDKLYGVNNKKK